MLDWGYELIQPLQRIRPWAWSRLEVALRQDVMFLTVNCGCKTEPCDSTWFKTELSQDGEACAGHGGHHGNYASKSDSVLQSTNAYAAAAAGRSTGKVELIVLS